LSAPWRPRALDRRAGSREPAHAREGRARRRRDPVRERGGEAHRARVTADGHLRRDLRHLRELRGAMAEPSRGGGARRRGAPGLDGGRDVLGKGAGVHNGIEQLATTWQSLPDYARSTAWILVITVALIISVALLTLWERKVIGWMQLRRGPNRVRLFGVAPGLGQPFADVLKLLLKEVVVPANSDKFLFRLAPVIALVPALAAWAVIP